MITQEEYNVTKQNSRILYAKINLLNFNFQIVDELSGVILPSSTYTIESTSDIRRTCNISLVPTDSSFDISYGSKIWIDKYVQIYVGIKDNNTNDIVYTKLGTYIINNPSQVYSADNNTITIKGLDLMAKMTGLRNGNLEGLSVNIPQNSNVRTSIISTLALAGFTNYIVEECPYSVPNDINIDVGGTVYDILKKLVEIDSSYEMYFDVDGIFHYDLIPNGYNEQVMVDDDIWNNTLIEYSIDHDFENVKNVIEIYGKTWDITNYGDATIYSQTSSDIYCSLTISTLSTLYDNAIIGFTTPSTQMNGNIYFYINSTDYSTSYQLKNEDGSTPTLSTNTYYVMKYIQDGGYLLFMSELTPYAIAKDNNINSPFYVNGTSGEIRIVLNGGDYDNIYMSSLAQERANYELYLRCRIQDSLSMTCLPIYWLDVNWVIDITLPNKQGNENVERYITKSINTTLSTDGTQSISLMKYYAI